eukprot:CAMPEP_0202483820 /NCGR_PEP_ID=MMETSP1361-20130828/2993_1 /ASSEMBLY_ACC=CAM_ASM_000849 /TAXON_ID=210615 /ORGANISM="Staurosira complex sp., Strain CCMP2646" /LENGTH=41 /DNA_ID= /DNA_START= /DNA_END= /DNA_ORIENTATION=
MTLKWSTSFKSQNDDKIQTTTRPNGQERNAPSGGKIDNNKL